MRARQRLSACILYASTSGFLSTMQDGTGISIHTLIIKFKITLDRVNLRKEIRRKREEEEKEKKNDYSAFKLEQRVFTKP